MNVSIMKLMDKPNRDPNKKASQVQRNGVLVNLTNGELRALDGARKAVPRATFLRAMMRAKLKYSVPGDEL